ncbi:MAG: hypothetical protein AAGK04_09185 [Planctomycetota bacterium]
MTQQGNTSARRQTMAVGAATAAMGLAIGLWLGAGEPSAYAQGASPRVMDGGIVTSTDQRRMMIRELQQVNERLARIEIQLKQTNASPGR